MESPGNRTHRNLRVLTGRSPERRPRTPGELEREAGLRFIMHLRGKGMTPGDIAGCIRATHDLDVVVRVFAPWRDTARDGQRFLIAIPGVARGDIPQNPFDLARLLEHVDGLDVAAVEPDIPTGVFSGVPVDAVASFFGGFCSEDKQEHLPRDWHVRTVNAPAAWNLEPPSAGRRFGEGIRIGHPDTGWLEHDELDATALDLDHDYDVIDHDSDARDPMTGGGLVPSPGHGLGTGSVIVSGHATGVLMGIAPAARLVPIRTTTSVAQIFGGAVAEAIEYALAQHCDVISISLGSLFMNELGDAIDDAIASDTIICAASGNCVPVIPFPAAYPSCIAVAATWNDDSPWDGSSEGRVVDVASPGVNIWVARREEGNDDRKRIGQSTGASPATATVAGAAALWLAFHGRDVLVAHYQDTTVRLQHVFTFLLHHTARTPVGWPRDTYGAGILDIHALLSAPLPTADEVLNELAIPDATRTVSALTLIAGMTSLSEDQVNVRVASLLGEPAVQSLNRRSMSAETGHVPLDLHIQELMAILTEHRSAYMAFVDSRHDRAASLAPDGGPESEPSFRSSRNEILRYASEGFREFARRET